MFSVESLSPESLSHVGPYPTRAFDLARYVDDPTDDLVDELVGHASNRKPAELDEWRGKLNEQDRYTLLQFARRRSAQGLRSERPDLVLQAVHALTLVEREKIDYRDLSVDFPLYAVRQLGISTDEVIDMAVLRSSLGTTQAFEASRLRARSATLADCALIQISSKYGLGFMEAWTRDYDTATGVAELSIEIADSIDTEGTYTALTLPRWAPPGSLVLATASDGRCTRERLRESRLSASWRETLESRATHLRCRRGLFVAGRRPCRQGAGSFRFLASACNNEFRTAANSLGGRLGNIWGSTSRNG